MRCVVSRWVGSENADIDWDGPRWGTVCSQAVDACLGGEPAVHRPHTRFKMAYTPAALHWVFQVEDRYVRAVARQHQDPVCRDSCVECFFSPGPVTGLGYFNVEINAGGTVLFHWQPEPKRDVVCVEASDLAALKVATTLPRMVDPEIEMPTVWRVACCLPLTILRRYAPVVDPAPGVEWRANFFKCGDATSHPHWLTWAPVERSSLGFHRPDAFGKLVFE